MNYRPEVDRQLIRYRVRVLVTLLGMKHATPHGKELAEQAIESMDF